MKNKSALLFTLFFVFYLPLYCQTFTLTGKVKNKWNGNAIEGSQVILLNTPFNQISDKEGRFSFDELAKGKYIFFVSATGFKSVQVLKRLKANKKYFEIELWPLDADEEANATKDMLKSIRSLNVAEIFSSQIEFTAKNNVYGIPAEPKKIIGNFYLDPKWNKANIQLYDQENILKGLLIRYNISSNTIEVKTEDSEKIIIIPGNKIQNLVWLDSKHRVPRYFVNGLDFKLEGSPISGFFEVLVEGNLPLVRRTMASIKESNYNETLMIGNYDHEIKKRNVYYYLIKNELFPIPKKKRELFKLFHEKESMMKKMFDESQLNMKDETNLFILFTNFNSQFEGFKPLTPKIVTQD
jgi:hypothetical protein